MKPLAIFLFISINSVHGGNVLAVLGTNLKSHFQIMSTVVSFIAKYHNVTFYLPEQLNYINQNVSTKNVEGPDRIQNFNMRTLVENACDYDTYDLFYKHILTDNCTYYDLLFQGKDIKELLKTKDKYDLLVISGYGAEHFIQLAHLKSIPVIQVLPSMLMPWHNDFAGSPFSWISDFSFMIKDLPHTFWGRLNKFIKQVLIWHRYNNEYIPAINHVTKNYFPPGTPKVENILENTDLVFANTRSVMGYARPSVQTIVEIGGLHCEAPKPLPGDIEKFVNGGEHGFIYFSLGTVVQGFTMPEYIKSGLVNVFRRLPQKILWKWNGEMTGLPDNVKIIKWAPQQDVLGHKNIKLFITQGGMLSMQETVYHGVPVLVIPVMFDQYTNGYVAQEKGYGRTINFCEFTEELFYENVQEILRNQKYSKLVTSLSRILHDQQGSTRAKVKWWVDFVIRYKGTAEFRPLSRHKIWVTNIPLDVIVFITGLIIFVVLFIVLIARYIYVVSLKYFWADKIKQS